MNVGTVPSGFQLGVCATPTLPLHQRRVFLWRALGLGSAGSG
jgi:hypothetical protein